LQANDADKKRIDEIKAAVKGMAEEAAEPLRAELDMLIGNIDKRSEARPATHHPQHYPTPLTCHEASAVEHGAVFCLVRDGLSSRSTRN
jgi:hypothetical protein